MTWTLFIFFAIAAVALIVFLVIRNQKDEKKFENDLNRDNIIEDEDDIEIEELTK